MRLHTPQRSRSTVRLGLECLEGRDLPSTTVSAAPHAPAPAAHVQSQAQPALVNYTFTWTVGPGPVLTGTNSSTRNGRSTGSVVFPLYAPAGGSATLGGAATSFPIGLFLPSSSAGLTRPDIYQSAFTLQGRLTDSASRASATLTFHGTLSGTLNWENSTLTVTFSSATQKVMLAGRLYTVTLPRGIRLPAPGFNFHLDASVQVSGPSPAGVTPTGSNGGHGPTPSPNTSNPAREPDPVLAVLVDDSLWEKTSAGWVMLSPAGTILSASAVTDAAGHDVAFAITADHNLWQHSAALPGDGWALVSAGDFQSVSAATNSAGSAVAFGVVADESLWEFSSLFPNADHWRMLSPAGSVLSVSAVTDAAGREVAFAVTTDAHLWQHTPAGWSMLSAGAFAGVSAGRNSLGQAVVYGMLADHSLWEYNPAFANTDHWLRLSPAGTMLGVSAGGPDQVFAITADRHLSQHTLSGWTVLSASSLTTLSGQGNGGHGEVFAVLADGSLWQYTTSWALLDPTGVLAAVAAQRA
jgi:hypothetical protein